MRTNTTREVAWIINLESDCAMKFEAEETATTFKRVSAWGSIRGMTLPQLSMTPPEPPK